MDLHQVALKGSLHGDDALDEKWVGVFEVEVHDCHHADTHELRLVQGTQLLLVVGLDGGGDGFGLFGAAHRCWFDVFEDGAVCLHKTISLTVSSVSRGIRTFLLIDLHAHVDVNAEDDQVAEDVERSHAVEDVRVIERHLLARLHHHQDDDQVGASKRHASGSRL